MEADASEFLHLAATASATALALEEAREREAAQAHGGLLAQLAGGALDGRGAGAPRRGRGLDLAGGLVVSVTDVGAAARARRWR